MQQIQNEQKSFTLIGMRAEYPPLQNKSYIKNSVSGSHIDSNNLRVYVCMDAPIMNWIAQGGKLKFTISMK